MPSNAFANASWLPAGPAIGVLPPNPGPCARRIVGRRAAYASYCVCSDGTNVLGPSLPPFKNNMTMQGFATAPSATADSNAVCHGIFDAA